MLKKLVDYFSKSKTLFYDTYSYPDRSHLIFPELSLDELLNDKHGNLKKILNIFEKDPIADKIYTFEITGDNARRVYNFCDDFINEPQFKKHNLIKKDYCIAGSYALWLFIKFFTGKSMDEEEKWKYSDIDIFNLKANKVDKLEYNYDGENFQFIDTKYTNIEDLIKNFDLPICKVSFSEIERNRVVLHISAQALVCIFLTNAYFIPSYFDDYKQYLDIIHISSRKDYFQRLIKDYFFKVVFRIKKYESRGYRPIFIKTDEPVSYIKSQFLNPDSYFNELIDYYRYDEDGEMSNDEDGEMSNDEDGEMSNDEDGEISNDEEEL